MAIEETGKCDICGDPSSRKDVDGLWICDVCAKPDYCDSCGETMPGDHLESCEINGQTGGDQ